MLPRIVESAHLDLRAPDLLIDGARFHLPKCYGHADTSIQRLTADDSS